MLRRMTMRNTFARKMPPGRTRAARSLLLGTRRCRDKLSRERGRLRFRAEALERGLRQSLCRSDQGRKQVDSRLQTMCLTERKESVGDVRRGEDGKSFAGFDVAQQVPLPVCDDVRHGLCRSSL